MELHCGKVILGSAIGSSMTTVTELLPCMLMFVSMIGCLRCLGGSMRSNSRVYWQILLACCFVLKSIQRVNAQELTEQVNTQEIFAEVCRLPRKGELVEFTLPKGEKRALQSTLLNPRTPVSDEHLSGVVSRLPRKGELIVFTPPTGDKGALPTLLNPCTPVSDEHLSGVVSRLPRKGELVVFTPPTAEKGALPTLLNPRTPVLDHIVVNSSHDFFKLIVSGSSTASDEHVLREVEVFDSVPSECKGKGDPPGSAFALNEHQGGVCVVDTPICILFLENGGRRMVAFEVEIEKWVTCAIPDSGSCNTLRLVESGGKVYLFSAPDRGEHCIDELEFLTATTRRWKNVIRVKTSEARSLPVDSAQTCVGFRDGKLCIFNARNRDGVVDVIRVGEFLVKTSGHGDSRAANYAKQVLSKVLRLLGAMSIPQKISLAFGVFCNLHQRANAQQLTGSSDPADPAAWLTSDTAKVASMTLLVGVVGAVFIFMRFFRRRPTFTVASINAGLEASPPRVRRDDLDSIYPRIDECSP